MRAAPITNEAWAAAQVEALPRSWQVRLAREWERRRAAFNRAKVTGEGEAQRAANVSLREACAAALAHTVHEELPLDSDDGSVIAWAQMRAEQARVLYLTLLARQVASRCAIQAAGVPLDVLTEHEEREARAALAEFCEESGIAPAEGRMSDLGAARRMIAPRWWTLKARRAQARAVEAAAIDLGFVNVSRDCYVSDVGLEARTAQNARNAAMLEATIARNLDTEQEFTLAQLSAKGPANRAIRRAELMTRINGFERIAIAAQHAGLFLTITCPSKMHASRMAGKAGAKRNRKYDLTKPDDAQAYLVGIWARIRSALARRGIALYGFRIAEPQHDGTPHWHLLLFYAPEHEATIESIVRRYALEMDGMEKGAQENRCDFKRMDPAIGTAAAYIAKYVAKNIDGYRLEKDLYGNDSIEASARVDAWASRWRIRQFQQVGGPPVTVWRELRRVESVPADAPAHVIAAHNAVNKVAMLEGRENASVAWDHYVNAQGGVHCGRNYRVRIAKVASDTMTAYGEESPAKPVGIEYGDVYRVIDGIAKYSRNRVVTVESKRFEWQIIRLAHSAGVAVSPVEGFALDVPVLGFGFERAQRAPRTCVNNCTEGGNFGRVRIENRGDLPRHGEPGGGTSSAGRESGSESGTRWH